MPCLGPICLTQAWICYGKFRIGSRLISNFKIVRKVCFVLLNLSWGSNLSYFSSFEFSKMVKLLCSRVPKIISINARLEG